MLADTAATPLRRAKSSWTTSRPAPRAASRNRPRKEHAESRRGRATTRPPREGKQAGTLRRYLAMASICGTALAILRYWKESHVGALWAAYAFVALALIVYPLGQRRRIALSALLLIGTGVVHTQLPPMETGNH